MNLNISIRRLTEWWRIDEDHDVCEDCLPNATNLREKGPGIESPLRINGITNLTEREFIPNEERGVRQDPARRPHPHPHGPGRAWAHGRCVCVSVPGSPPSYTARLPEARGTEAFPGFLLPPRFSVCLCVAFPRAKFLRELPTSPLSFHRRHHSRKTSQTRSAAARPKCDGRADEDRGFSSTTSTRRGRERRAARALKFNAPPPRFVDAGRRTVTEKS